MSADPGRTSVVRHANSVGILHRAWTAVLPPHARAAGLARQAISDVLVTWGLSEVEDAAVLISSELIANSVVHTGGSASSLQLRLHAGDGWLRVEVHDCDPRPPQLQTPSGLDESGRGLLLVDAIADQWGVDGTAAGKAVWAVLACRGRR